MLPSYPTAPDRRSFAPISAGRDSERADAPSPIRIEFHEDGGEAPSPLLSRHRPPVLGSAKRIRRMFAAIRHNAISSGCLSQGN
jgi:hypothetical protein